MTAIRSITSLLTYGIGLCGMVPLFPWLTPVPRMVLVAGILSGIWQDRTGRWPFKPWLQNTLIVPIFFFYALQFSRANPVQPVVSTLAIMLAVRLGGEKTTRHCLQIYALSLFCLASSSLFDLSPIFLVYLGILLVAVALALVLITFQSQDQDMTVSRKDLKSIMVSGLLMPLLSVPLLLFFFPIMPRTQMPLWHFLNPPPAGVTGYSDKVDPGSHASISESRMLAFRAEMPQQELSQLYWRGTVFNRTDGFRWTRSTQVPLEKSNAVGAPVMQLVYPEPSATHTLIALDRPSSLTLQRVIHYPDGVFERSGGDGRRLSYDAYSHSHGQVRLQNTISRQYYLQQPELLPEKIRALAAEIIRNGTDDRSKLNYLENYFRNGGYRYSTHGLPTGNRALEHFLFESKQGHCEFFASSFALLLRAAGVPSRLVGGYLGGEYNQLGGYYLVTDDKSHVWVEAYIEGRGWQRIDPSSFAVNAGDVWKAPGSPNLKLRFSMVVDSFNHSWNRSVIAYDFEQQMNAARSISSRLQDINPFHSIRNWWASIASIFVCAALLFAIKKTSLFLPREQRIVKRYYRLVEREYTISAARKFNAGLFEIAAETGNSQLFDFASIYAGAVYRDRRLTDEEYYHLKLLLRSLEGGTGKIS
jgi:transglutaminase-like putative cysteine protease